MLFIKKTLCFNSKIILKVDVELDFYNKSIGDLYPSTDSKLIDAGTESFDVTTDFNGTPRVGKADAGVYTYVGKSNNGWRVTAGFKEIIRGDKLPSATLTNFRQKSP